MSPRKGKRIRFIRTRVIQDAPDGRHLWELYFGVGGNMITAPSRALEILAVPDQATVSTRTFLKNEGPRGKRDEVLSGRWRGTAPTNSHTIIIEYIEES